LSRTMQFGLLAALSLPVASFVSVAWFWNSGPGFALLAIAAAMLGLAGVAVLMGSRKRLSGPRLILALTFAFFIADLAVGAPSQIDSIFGYTSVAAGRFFGLGNSGFGLLAAAAFLLAGILADSRVPRGRWIAFGVIAVAIVADGHPLLGDDVGGTLSLAPAAVAFALGLSAREKSSKKYLLIGVLAAVGAVAVFGAIDLARPVAARTHLGDFLSNAFIHPASVWLIFKRKAGLAVSIALSNYLGLAVPGAVAVLILLHRRTGHRLRTLLKGHQGLSAGLDALIVAAVLGSILNDSGLAVAGMMLAIAAPWSIIVASELASPSPAG